MTRKLSVIKISCRLADYNVKKGQQTALCPQGLLEHPCKKPSGLLALKPPTESFAVAEKHINVLLLETTTKKRGGILQTWVPSSIHHPAREVWNPPPCTRVFAFPSVCELLCCANACLTLQGGRTDALYIQQTCNKCNLAPSTHLQTLGFLLAGKKKKLQTKQNVNNASATVLIVIRFADSLGVARHSLRIRTPQASCHPDGDGQIDREEKGTGDRSGVTAAARHRNNKTWGAWEWRDLFFERNEPRTHMLVYSFLLSWKKIWINAN